MIRRPPRSTQSRSSAASDVYKRQERFVVRSPVGGGHRVQCPAVARDFAEDGAFGEVRSALELHVLDPVGGAGEARDLVAAADPVPDPKRGDRSVVLLAEEDLEPVVQGFDASGRW